MTWTLDPSHTSVNFAVQHMGIATVRGAFEDVEGTLEASEGDAPPAIDVTIKTKSISTHDQNRDAHLRSADFFEVDRYSDMRFENTDIQSLGDSRYLTSGDLPIRDVNRPVSFEAEASRIIIDPYGNRRLAATASGQLNRKDWGLTWNQVLEMGALLVSEEVRFTLEVQATAQSPVTAS